MQTQSGRFAGFVALLAALWIGVYWWWPGDHAKVSFAGGGAPPVGPAANVPGPTANTMPTGPIDLFHVPATHVPTTPGEGTSPAAKPRPTPREVLAPIVVQPPQFIEHTVRPGETLSAISKQYFGTNSHVNDILRSNPYLDPTRLRPGRVIKVPKDPGNIQGKPVEHPEQVLPAKAPDNAPSVPAVREYVVQRGDTLSGIASDIYGTSGMARAIFEANRSIMADEDSLRVGLRLKLPPKDR